MWIIIKFEKKNLNFLKLELEKKLGFNCQFYIPKLLLKRYQKNKLIKKEFNLLGEYLFCFNEKFCDSNNTKEINYVMGLKYILNGFRQSQKEINQFIQQCKDSEDKDGYIYEQFYDLKINSNYKLSSGPFTNSICKIIQLQKNKIRTLMGNFKTTINKKAFFLQPV